MPPPLLTRPPACVRAVSPYNMVKLIPSKEHSEMFGQWREPSYVPDDDMDDF